MKCMKICAGVLQIRPIALFTDLHNQSVGVASVTHYTQLEMLGFCMNVHVIYDMVKLNASIIACYNNMYVNKFQAVDLVHRNITYYDSLGIEKTNVLLIEEFLHGLDKCITKQGWKLCYAKVCKDNKRKE